MTIRAIYSLPERQPRHAEYQIGGGSVSGYDRPFITRCSPAKADRFSSWVDALKKDFERRLRAISIQDKRRTRKIDSSQQHDSIGARRQRAVDFSNSIGHGLPSRLRWGHDRCSPDSRCLAAMPKSAALGHKETFSGCWTQRNHRRHRLVACRAARVSFGGATADLRRFVRQPSEPRGGDAASLRDLRGARPKRERK